MATKQIEAESDDANNQAAKLAEKLLRRIDEGEGSDVSAGNDVETSDVEANVDRFAELFHLSERYREPIPCVDFGYDKIAPVDLLPQSLWLDQVTPPERREMLFLRHFYWRHWSRQTTDEMLSGRVVMADAREALTYFRSGLVRFLTSRFNYPTRTHASSGGTPSPGMPFKVFTKRNGQRVHFTCSYLINTNAVFGAPTSPALGYMHPGLWKFGVWKHGRVQLDPADFDVPMVSQAMLVI